MYEKAKAYMMDHQVDLFVTFSRRAMVKPFFPNLLNIDLPSKNINLFIYNNTEMDLLHKDLQKWAEICKDYFGRVELYKSGRRIGTTLMGMPNEDFEKSKLRPIWEMWLDIKNRISTDIFMIIEDDTLVPRNAFWKLLEDLLTLDKAGFVTGIETGRTAFEWSSVRLGIHKMSVKNNHILKRVSLDPNLEGIHKIDASGVYCFVAYKKAYEKGFVGMEKYVYKTPFFGMDNILTYNIKKEGYELYADFDVWCEHIQMGGSNLISFGKETCEIMADIWIPEFNNYGQGIIPKDASIKSLNKKDTANKKKA